LLRDALRTGHARLRPSGNENMQAILVLEDESGDIVHADQPISFKKGARQFTVRRVKTEFCELPSASQLLTKNLKS